MGITLDRSLTYRNHLEKSKKKLSTRNYIIRKLAGTTWGCRADSLRTSSLALVYSAAEYCCPVWLNSSHTKLIDTQLNTTMRIITGSLKSTPLDWLPVLSNIPPSDLRRKEATLKEYRKILNSPNVPLHNDILQYSSPRLKSRKPFWTTGHELSNTFSGKSGLTDGIIPLQRTNT